MFLRVFNVHRRELGVETQVEGVNVVKVWGVKIKFGSFWFVECIGLRINKGKHSKTKQKYEVGSRGDYHEVMGGIYNIKIIFRRL